MGTQRNSDGTYLQLLQAAIKIKCFKYLNILL